MCCMLQTMGFPFTIRTRDARNVRKGLKCLSIIFYRSLPVHTMLVTTTPSVGLDQIIDHSKYCLCIVGP